jgi:hypothetical protein
MIPPASLNSLSDTMGRMADMLLERSADLSRIAGQCEGFDDTDHVLVAGALQFIVAALQTREMHRIIESTADPDPYRAEISDLYERMDPDRQLRLLNAAREISRQ